MIASPIAVSTGDPTQGTMTSRQQPMKKTIGMGSETCNWFVDYTTENEESLLWWVEEHQAVWNGNRKEQRWQLQGLIINAFNRRSSCLWSSRLTTNCKPIADLDVIDEFDDIVGEEQVGEWEKTLQMSHQKVCGFTFANRHNDCGNWRAGATMDHGEQLRHLTFTSANIEESAKSMRQSDLKRDVPWKERNVIVFASIHKRVYNVFAQNNTCTHMRRSCIV